VKKPVKIEEIEIKTQAGQTNTHSFVLSMALDYRELKAKTC